MERGRRGGPRNNFRFPISIYFTSHKKPQTSASSLSYRASGFSVLQRAVVRFGRKMALPKAKEIVASNPVVVFSKSYCPFCVTVKQLLTQLGATFKAIELDTESDGSEIQSALAEWTGQKTVPNVFIGGNQIGGCDKTTALHKEGKLIPLLTEAGVLPKSAA